MDKDKKFLLCANTLATPLVKDQLGERLVRIAKDEFSDGSSQDPAQIRAAQHCTEFYNRSSVNVGQTVVVLRCNAYLAGSRAAASNACRMARESATS